MSKKLPTEKLCERYGDRSPRTIYRWVAAGILPKPTYIKGRRYWDEDELDAHDAARQAEQAS
jgi:predicted DNA-binding transcriptional regulator AlpA